MENHHAINIIHGKIQLFLWPFSMSQPVNVITGMSGQQSR
jgi:hypothetical protein